MDLWNSITLLEIESILTVPSARGRHFEMKNRANYGLSFCAGGGRIVYTQNGKRYESDRNVAVLLPMHGCYSLYGAETGNFPLINFVAPEGLSNGEFYVTRLRNPDAYLRAYERLKETWLIRHDRAKAMSILYEILSSLSREETDSTYHPIRPAVSYLTEHIKDPTLSCADLARAAGLSEVYFRRLFKEHYGIPPKQYVQDLRIRHAKTLLAENRATVTEISEACGFSSVYHFCRAFRSATGETPTAYRAKDRF